MLKGNLHAGDRARVQRYVGECLLLALVYAGTGYVGLRLAPVTQSAMLIWPPSGIALAALLFRGRCLWPGVTLGALLVNAFTGSFVIGLFFCVGNTLEAVAASTWLRQPNQKLWGLRRPADLGRFLIVSGLAPSIAASGGALTLWLSGRIAPDAVLKAFGNWWMGDSGSILLLTPALVVLRHALAGRTAELRGPGTLREGALLSSFLVCLLFFGWFGVGDTPLSGSPSLLISFPLLVWAGLRFGQVGASLSTLFVVVGAISVTGLDAGPFVDGSPLESLTGYLLFVATAAGTSLLTAVLASAERDARRSAEAANAAKSDFLARMSHELRTPLHGVIGSANVLSTADLPTPQKGQVETIQLSAQILLSTINDVLDFSRIEAGKLDVSAEPFSLSDCIGDALAVVGSEAQHKGLALNFHVDDAVPDQILGDYIRLRQVLLNLVKNAVKFTDSGSVLVTADVIPSGDDISESTPSLRLTVEDTGIGIPPAIAKDLFQPFVQVGGGINVQQGTGLGLSICANLVSLMGGTIEIDGELDHGTCVRVEVPLVAAPPTGDGHEASESSALELVPPAAIENLGLSLLVVEDNPISQKVTSQLLELLGCRVELADNGVEALDRLAGSSFDLVFMDCDMPRLNGFDATAQLRSQESLQALPVIGLTAHATHRDRQKCLDSGMNDFLTKPVTATDLRKALVRWTEERPDC